MRKLFWPLRLLAATASLSVMLTACASSPKPAPEPPQASDPVVTTQVRTRTVCPAELDQTPPDQPVPATDAKIATNASGGAYLAALVGWGEALGRQLSDAATACHAAQAADRQP